MFNVSAILPWMMITFDALLSKEHIINVIAGTRPSWHRLFVLGIAVAELGILAFLTPPALLLIETAGGLSEHGTVWQNQVLLEHIREPQFIFGILFVVFVGIPVFLYLIWSAVSHMLDAVNNRRTIRQTLKKVDGVDQWHSYSLSDEGMSVRKPSQTQEVYQFSEFRGFRFVGDALCLDFKAKKRGVAIVPVPDDHRERTENLISTHLRAR